jgi:hypothetical protein
MERQEFLSLVGAAGVALGAFPAIVRASADIQQGARVSQAALFSSLPIARPGLWIRYVMGFGIPYQKQIGFGIEETPIATRYFIETQVGMPGGSCNPDSVKKAYLKTREFGGLIEAYGVYAYVARNNNMLLYDEDSTPLLLLDSRHLYNDAPCTVGALTPETVSVPGHPVKQSEGSIVVAKDHAPTTQCAARFSGGGLRELRVWQSASLPLGVAKIEAHVDGMEPFALALDSWGTDFRTNIPEPLDTVKAEQS